MRKPLEFQRHPMDYATARGQGLFRGYCQLVIDGDTYDIFVDLGMGKYAYEPIRLNGIGTPEIFRPKDAAEKAAGFRAKDRVATLIMGKPVLIRTYRDDQTFGRYVADVWYYAGTEWKDLGELLVNEGLGVRV